jgi:hypothetical protein
MAQRVIGKPLFIPQPDEAETISPWVLDTLQELADMGQQWFQAEIRSLAEQELMSHQLRCLLIEVESGYLDNLSERFQQASDEVKALSHNEEPQA